MIKDPEFRLKCWCFFHFSTVMLRLNCAMFSFFNLIIVNFEMIIKRTWINLWRLLTMINLEVYWPWLNFDVYWPGLTCRIDLCYIKIDSPLLNLPIFVCHFTMIVIFYLDLPLSYWPGFIYIGLNWIYLCRIHICRIDLDLRLSYRLGFSCRMDLDFSVIVLTLINLCRFSWIYFYRIHLD